MENGIWAKFVDGLDKRSAVTYSLAILVFLFLLILAALLPAPKSLNGVAFSYASLVLGGLAGMAVGSLLTPASSTEKDRFGSLKPFVLGLGGGALIAATRQGVLNDLNAAFTNPDYTGPVVAFIGAALMSAMVTYVARTPEHDTGSNAFERYYLAADTEVRVPASAVRTQQPKKSH